MGKRQSGLAEPAYDVRWDYDPTDDGEDRLLKVYELLLGLPEASEIDQGGQN